MVCDTIRKLIGQADDAIREQRYDDLMEFYTDDAVLVVRPGKEAHGKPVLVCGSLYLLSELFTLWPAFLKPSR